MNRSKGNWPNYEPCKPITLLTHTGVRKFQLQKEVLGPNMPYRTKSLQQICIWWCISSWHMELTTYVGEAVNRSHGSLQVKHNCFLLNSLLVGSSILPLPRSNPLGSLPPWFIGGLSSLPPWFRGGLGVNLAFVAYPKSLVFQVASCKLVGLKTLTQPLKGSINPSMKSIISLDWDTSCTITAILWNSSI